MTVYCLPVEGATVYPTLSSAENPLIDMKSAFTSDICPEGFTWFKGNCRQGFYILFINHYFF